MTTAEKIEIRIIELNEKLARVKTNWEKEFILEMIKVNLQVLAIVNPKKN